MMTAWAMASPRRSTDRQSSAISRYVACGLPFFLCSPIAGLTMIE
jgi:hypothetical protein